MTDATTLRVALTIAGSDCSGGAGLQADLKTFHQFGVYGASLVTLLTAQNSRGVSDVRVLDEGFVRAQWDAVLAECRPDAIKTGALGNAGVVKAVAECLQNVNCPVVVDPVILSKSGGRLLDEEGTNALREQLFPLATLLTPNRREAELLTGLTVNDLASMEQAAAMIGKWGSRYVLIKGAGIDGKAMDVLYSSGQFVWFHRELIPDAQTHGSGCVFSAAITALLAQGKDVLKAVDVAKDYITEALRTQKTAENGFVAVNIHAPVVQRGGHF